MDDPGHTLKNQRDQNPDKPPSSETSHSASPQQSISRSTAAEIKNTRSTKDKGTGADSTTVNGRGGERIWSHISPEAAEARRLRGLALYDSGNFKKAINSFDRGRAIDSTLRESWIIRGYALHKLERYDEEIASYDRVLVMEPKLTSIWNKRADALLKLKHTHEMVLNYERAVEANPDNLDLRIRLYLIKEGNLRSKDESNLKGC
jgi:tetratricopeptide (TPR) repeat protein